MSASLSMPSPIGPLLLEAADGRLTHIHIGQHPSRPDMSSGSTADHAVLYEAKRQLDEYFAGKRREFDLPYDLVGTAFQMKVWSALLRIPYGSTVNYGTVAEWVGKPKGAQAVGGANKRNKLPIIVPCHRVLGVDGKSCGYTPGVGKQLTLLKLEQR